MKNRCHFAVPLLVVMCFSMFAMWEESSINEYEIALESNLKKKLSICKALLLGLDFVKLPAVIIVAQGGYAGGMVAPLKRRVDDEYSLEYFYVVVKSGKVPDKICIKNKKQTVLEFCPFLPEAKNLTHEQLDTISSVYDRFVKSQAGCAAQLPACDNLLSGQILYLYELLTLHDRAIEENRSWQWYEDRLEQLKTSDIKPIFKLTQWARCLNDRTEHHFLDKSNGLMRLASRSLPSKYNALCDLDKSVVWGAADTSQTMRDLGCHFNEKLFARIEQHDKDNDLRRKVIHELRKKLFRCCHGHCVIRESSHWFGKKYTLTDTNNHDREVSMYSFKITWHREWGRVKDFLWRYDDLLPLMWIPLICVMLNVGRKAG